MKSFLPDKVYEVLKWVALIVIPALGEAYLRLADVWGLPYGQAINETALILTFFIGALIGVSTVQYNRGVNADIQQIGQEVQAVQTSIQQEITPEIGKEMKLVDPVDFDELKEVEQ